MDGLVNWENSSSDGERFSQQISNSKGNKSLRSFDEYIVKKEARAATKKIEGERLTKVKKSKLVKSEVHVKSKGYKLKAKSGKHRLS